MAIPAHDACAIRKGAHNTHPRAPCHGVPHQPVNLSGDLATCRRFWHGQPMKLLIILLWLAASAEKGEIESDTDYVDDATVFFTLGLSATSVQAKT